MAHEPNLKDLNELVDRLLREQRPDRYTSDEWIEPVIESIPVELIPEEDIRRFALQQFVKRRESQATRKANSLLRSIGESGQLILGWWEQSNDPISLITEIVDEEGNTTQFKERVALRAATPEDLRAWSRTERERAGADYKSRLTACDGADYIADSMTGSGVRKFAQWAQNEAPHDESDE
jgi:hypothetical protein